MSVAEESPRGVCPKTDSPVVIAWNGEGRDRLFKWSCVCSSSGECKFEDRAVATRPVEDESSRARPVQY